MTIDEARNAVGRVNKLLASGMNTNEAAIEAGFNTAGGYQYWRKKLGKGQSTASMFTIDDKPLTSQKFILQTIKASLRQVQEMVYELERHL